MRIRCVCVVTTLMRARVCDVMIVKGSAIRHAHTYTCMCVDMGPVPTSIYGYAYMSVVVWWSVCEYA